MIYVTRCKFHFTDRPVANIILRSTRNFNKVREGDNITLECAVNANPAVTAITWYHNVSTLYLATLFLYPFNITSHSHFDDKSSGKL